MRVKGMLHVRRLNGHFEELLPPSQARRKYNLAPFQGLGCKIYFEDLFNIAAPGLRCHLVKSSLMLISASHSMDRSSSTAIMCLLCTALNRTVPYRAFLGLSSLPEESNASYQG
jgi:hypothetical protein